MWLTKRYQFIIFQWIWSVGAQSNCIHSMVFYKRFTKVMDQNTMIFMWIETRAKWRGRVYLREVFIEQKECLDRMALWESDSVFAILFVSVHTISKACAPCTVPKSAFQTVWIKQWNEIWSMLMKELTWFGSLQMECWFIFRGWCRSLGAVKSWTDAIQIKVVTAIK